jgi:hypothetical protein
MNKLVRLELVSTSDQIEGSTMGRGLGPVGIQDSHSSLSMIQAFDGTIRVDLRSMGEDGAPVSG